MIWANEAMENLFGFRKKEDYLGKNCSILYFDEEEYKRVGKQLYSSGGKTWVLDTRFRRFDNGKEFFAQVRTSAVNPLDPMEGNIINIIDVTERKKAEIALRESEERFRTVMEHPSRGYYRS